MFENLFRLDRKVAVVTGAGNGLGRVFSLGLAAHGATVICADRNLEGADETASLAKQSRGVAEAIRVDVASESSVDTMWDEIAANYGRIDILINNAANNPKVEDGNSAWSRLENFPLEVWDADIRVGLTGAFLCSRVFGAEMAKRKSGVIVNVASDLAVIAPDQRLYRVEGLPEEQQPVKPVTYSVVKTALLGLTRYLATYWSSSNIRVNAISPGGVFNGQPEVFLSRLKQLIPLERMANRDEYQGAILFLCSDASSYMTGSNLVIDGGRSCL